MRYVDQPAGHQRLEHVRVAQTALGLLQVRDRGVGELTAAPAAASSPSRASREPGARVAPPLGQHGGAQPQGQVGVAGEVPYVEHPGRHARVRRGLRQHLLDRAHRVVDVGPGVPQRVPDLAGPVAGRHRGVVDQHHVEVAVRRELLAPVAADRHQGDARVRAARLLERLPAQLVGCARALGPLGGGHPDLSCPTCRLERRLVPVAGAHPDHALHRLHPDLPVADPTRGAPPRRWPR